MIYFSYNLFICSNMRPADSCLMWDLLSHSNEIYCFLLTGAPWSASGRNLISGRVYSTEDVSVSLCRLFVFFLTLLDHLTMSTVAETQTRFTSGLCCLVLMFVLVICSKHSKYYKHNHSEEFNYNWALNEMFQPREVHWAHLSHKRAFPKCFWVFKRGKWIYSSRPVHNNHTSHRTIIKKCW